MSERSSPVDLLVVGGGVNGVGIASDAAGRGLSVVLCEQDDLASATSSASSKLIHGGLRYLEHYEFRLVREALSEREVLLAKAPHIIRPLRFVLPHQETMRPFWLIRLGLFIYDHLGQKTQLPRSTSLDLEQGLYGAPLRRSLSKGFIYSDCWVDDARLVVLNAFRAAEGGARILTRTKLVRARRLDGVWQARLSDLLSGREQTITARVLVNAAGPWAHEVMQGALYINSPMKVRLLKGSHIVVPRLYYGEHAYILQHEDGRVVFVIPYEGRFSLIGTTEIPFEGDPATACMAADEAAYLCDVVNGYFEAPVRPSDVVSSYAGVRPLYDDEAEDPSAITRDYVLELNSDNGTGPLLSVFGGKITTYRRLAEQALDKLKPFLPNMGAAWTAWAPLPGGDLPTDGLCDLVADLGRTYPALDGAYLAALARRHGTLSAAVLGDAREMADLGQDFGAGLRAREVHYLVEQEWAQTVEDVLWRRTKCGLHLDVAAQRAVANYLGTLV